MPRVPDDLPTSSTGPSAGHATRSCPLALREKRTITLLYIPTIAAIATLWMTMHEYHIHGVVQEQRCYLVSCAVNYYPQVDERQLARTHGYTTAHLFGHAIITLSAEL